MHRLCAKKVHKIICAKNKHHLCARMFTNLDTKITINNKCTFWRKKIHKIWTKYVRKSAPIISNTYFALKRWKLNTNSASNKNKYLLTMEITGAKLWKNSFQERNKKQKIAIFTRRTCNTASEKSRTEMGVLWWEQAIKWSKFYANCLREIETKAQIWNKLYFTIAWHCFEKKL